MSGALRIAVKLVTTFFGVGFLPLVPGTWGSIAGILVFVVLPGTGLWRFSVFAGILVVGLIVSGAAEAAFGRKDPQYIVIDEVAGMMLSLLWLPAYNIKVFFLAFLLFRALDTIKPYPALQAQQCHGAVGIMGDDIVAAVYTNIVLQSVLRFAS